MSEKHDDDFAPDSQGGWEEPEPNPQRAVVPAGPPSEVKAVASEFSRFFGALWADTRARGLMLVSLFALCGICALGVYLISFFNSGDRANTARTTPTSAVANITPNATANAGGNGNTNPGGGTNAPSGTKAGLTANGTAIPPATPSRITFGTQSFVVETIAPDKNGNVKYNKDAKNTAFWFNGTLVNYVVGLNSSVENKQIFDAFKPNDVVSLDTGSGLQRYRVDKITQVKADDTSALRNQSTPQLTLVLMGESGDSRHLVTAKYMDEGQPNVLNPARYPINLEDLRIRVTGDLLVPGNTVGLATGKNYYLVNVELSNTSAQPIDMAQFFTELVDGNKTRFALSRAAAQSGGGRGWPQGGVLAPGQTVSYSAGFEVPDTMSGPRLEYRFAASANTPSVAMVSLPYSPPQPTAAPPGPVPLAADITIVTANLVPESNELRIVGSVVNRGTTQVQVSLKDVTVSSGGVSSALTNAIPAVPWTIPPGESLAFQVSFTRPAGGQPATFKVLDQAFEIGGL